MTPTERAEVVRESERLRPLTHQRDVQARTADQPLSAKGLKVARRDRISADEMAVIVGAIIPTLREVIRQEIKALGPLNEEWYEPREIAAMSCGRISARTLRDWLRFGQIDGESNGRQVRIYQKTVEALRKNKWRPLCPPDPSKMPPSKRPRSSPTSSVNR